MSSIKPSSTVPFSPVRQEQPTAVEAPNTSTAGTLPNTVSPQKQPGPSHTDAGRQMSEAFLAGNLFAAQLNAQYDQIQNAISAETSFPAVQKREALKLPNVSATLQGNTLTMTGDTAELSQFFLKAAVEGKPLPSLTMELPMLNESGIPIGTQTVLLSNAMVLSFETIDDLDRPLQKISLQFDKTEYLS
ncbi:MAG TPA: hypothetical protein VLH08_04720 [Acidobacteriota bacterium]|nr:hypothetical protein [Acidobacteriota bacterium]